MSLSTLNYLLNSLSFHFSFHVSLFPFVFCLFTSDHPLTIFSRPLHSITVFFSSFSHSESFFFTLFLFFVLFKFFCYNTFVIHQKYSFINRFLLLLITQFFPLSHKQSLITTFQIGRKQLQQLQTSISRFLDINPFCSSRLFNNFPSIY